MVKKKKVVVTHFSQEDVWLFWGWHSDLVFFFFPVLRQNYEVVFLVLLYHGLRATLSKVGILKQFLSNTRVGWPRSARPAPGC